MQQKYKKIIDKSKLQEFCLGECPVTKEHVEALNLLATVVVMKHFPSLRNKFKDLRQFMYLKACEVRHNHRFDPSKQDAYTFLYTVLYHDVQNKLWKYSKEPNFGDIVSSVVASESTKEETEFYEVMASYKGTTQSNENFDTFKELTEYLPYLSCEIPFVKKRIPSKDVLNLLIFLRMHEKKLMSSVELPGFIPEEQDSEVTRALYKLCSDLITLTEDGEED